MLNNKKISKTIFIKKQFIVILLIWIVLEFVHYFIKKYDSGFFLKLDDVINILRCVCSSIFTLLLIISFIIKSNNTILRTIKSNIGVLIVIFYLLFGGIGCLLIKITEGTERGLGPLWDIPFIGPMYEINTFVVAYTSFIILPIGIILLLYEILITKQSQKIVYLFLILSLIINTILLIYSGRIVGFILD